jgi:ribonuclease Z
VYIGDEVEKASKTTAGTSHIWFKAKHKAHLHVPRPQRNIHTDTWYPTKMKSYVQVITTPTADTPGTTLLLHFDSKRYIIGSLAEGTQRACVCMGTKLLKVSECFLSGRTEWTNTGGLIGMILTLADSNASSHASLVDEVLKKAKRRAAATGVLDNPQKLRRLEGEARKGISNQLTFFGPPNIMHTLATARRFVFRKGMPVNVHEIRGEGSGDNTDWEPMWEDENVKVWAMSISPVATDATKDEPLSASPRKRSFDEMRAGNDELAIDDDLTQEDRDYLTNKAIVGEMFNSTWKLDTLHETPLSQVRLPAAIFFRDPQTKKIEKYRGPLPGNHGTPLPDPDMTVLVRKPWPGALVESLPDTKPAKQAISYIFRNHTQRGKLLVEKAKQLKVRPGPNFAKLTKGESVANEDGEMIRPEQVMEPSRVGGGFAFVDLPAPEYIAPLLARPEWRQAKVMDGVGAITWNCGKDVATHPDLHAFMREFHHIKHIVSSPEYCPNSIALEAPAASNVRLQRIDPKRYVIPVHDAESDGSQPYGGQADFVEVQRKHPLPENAYVAARGQKLQLEPSIELQTQDVYKPLDITQAAAEVPAEVIAEATKAQEESAVVTEDVQKWLDSLPEGAADAEVITLGTGSSIPSKYRNVSATLVRVPGWGNMLFDCGENTLGQLKRFFTASEVKQVLQDLRILAISHMHADHQLGTTSVIKAWYEAKHGSQPAPMIPVTGNAKPDWQQIFGQGDRLAVISEGDMHKWLAEYSAVEDYGYSRLAPLIIKPAAIIERRSSELRWYVPRTKSETREWKWSGEAEAWKIPCSSLNLKDIQAVEVKHCKGARAMSITTPSGFKVSYSGDCRPSHKFAVIGKGSTVCIHEATFDDELQGDAEAKHHSTTSEALDVAQKMAARACVLTHFSQRYQKVPVMERVAGEPDLVEDVCLQDPDDDAVPGDDPAAHGDDDSAALDVAGTFFSHPPTHASGSGGWSGAAEPVKFQLKTDMKVAVAFDLMRVRVGDIWQMEKFTPALLKLFAVEEKEGAAGLGQSGINTGGKMRGKSEKRRN